MIRNAMICLTFVALGTFFAASELNAQSDLREIVQKRKNQMNAMEDAYWPLLDIKKGKSTDLAKGGESAKIMANAMVKALALFPFGTAKGEVLGSGSRARPGAGGRSGPRSAARTRLRPEPRARAASPFDPPRPTSSAEHTRRWREASVPGEPRQAGVMRSSTRPRASVRHSRRCRFSS